MGLDWMYSKGLKNVFSISMKYGFLVFQDTDDKYFTNKCMYPRSVYIFVLEKINGYDFNSHKCINNHTRINNIN